jgi:hypothetical protein
MNPERTLMADKDRLAEIVERCRAEMHPELNADVVAEIARIEVQFQFAGDDRGDAQRELKAAVSAALPVAKEPGGGA